MKAGFIGLGHMGSGMAANLIKAGHEVTVFNRTRDKMQPLVKQGARAAADVADACRGDAVITMLADDHSVEEVAYGDGGILKSLARGAVHVSMSTIGVDLSERLDGAHGEAGQRYVSAPVFGRPEAAAAARLFIVAGGAKEAVGACSPLFDAMGQQTFHLAEKPASANLVKLSGNFLIASLIESLGEAVALVGKAGVDPRLYVEFLTSTLFNAPIYKTYGRLIVEGKYEPVGFAAPLALKDIRLVMSASDRLRVPLPLAGLLRDRLLRLLAQEGDAVDWSAIARLAALDSGQAGR